MLSPRKNERNLDCADRVSLSRPRGRLYVRPVYAATMRNADDKKKDY